MNDVTTYQLLRPSTDIDQAAFAKFVAKTRRGYERWVRLAKTGTERERRRHRDYAEWTEVDVDAATRFYCNSYRHQFRVLVPVAAEG